MKISRHFLLFSLTVVFIFPMLINFGFANVTETQFWNNSAPLDGANLQVNVGSTPGLRQRLGARNLVEFTPRGSTVQGNYTRFSASAVFEFSLDFYSFYSTTECYPSAGNPGTVSHKYLGVTLCTSPKTTSTYKPRVDYYVSYSSYNLGQMAATGFDGVVSLGASVISLTPSSLDFGNEEFVITTKEFVGQVRRAEVKSSIAKEIAPYETYYNAETSAINVKTLDLTRDSPNTGGISADSLSTLGMSVVRTDSISAQQKAFDIPQKGADVLGNFHLTLKPEVTYTRQQLKLTSRNNVLIDTQKDFWDIRYGLLEDYSDPILTNDNLYRNIGWQLKNVLGALVIRVECDIYALVQIDSKITNTSMADPNVGLGDFWFNNQSGGTGGEIPLYSSPLSLFWDQYGLFIILGVVVVILIFTPAGPFLVRITLGAFRNWSSNSD